MKKILILIIIVTALMMTGCGDKNEQMTSFIPTPIPGSEDNSGETTSEETTEGSGETVGESTEATPTPKPLHVGQTTTMYVKLGEYDAILNIRSTPSKDGDVVGFLVHTEKLEIIEIVDGWASFAQGGSIRYVSSDFLVNERPDYIEPPTATPVPTNKPTPTTKPETVNKPQVNTPSSDSEEAPPEI
ncbi:MAG: hypothetical protein K0R46_2023 [Herbinix sp.]|jgi:hypothetical protein|nr:hypothetical protein [Herbinix sp.]